MKKILKLIYVGIIIFVISLVILLITDVKLALVVFSLALLINSYFIYKEKIGQELIIAFLFALVITSYYFYEYTNNNLTIDKINLFPLILWTAGLVLLREIYEKVSKNKLLKITIIYWISLFVIEYLGYYFLGIRLNSSYTGLFNLGIIHGPIGMKLFYLLAGTVYILITDYLKVK